MTIHMPHYTSYELCIVLLNFIQAVSDAGRQFDCDQHKQTVLNPLGERFASVVFFTAKLWRKVKVGSSGAGLIHRHVQSLRCRRVSVS